jgi:pyruvate-formate lyase-activating enzyme
MSGFCHPYPHVDGHPSLAEVELTSACNARCVFCPRHLFTRPTTMTRRTFEQLTRRLVEARMTHVKLVGIGEPTLHRDLLWMLRELRRAGLVPLLNTNGSRLHRWDVDELLTLCEEIIVSVHSLDRKTHQEIFGVDIYDKVVANLETLIAANERHRRKITLYVVMTTLNRDALDTLARFRSKVHLRVSGCTNRALDGFAEHLVDFGASGEHNHYGAFLPGGSMCGYADAALVVDSMGRYLVCTNDVERNTGLGDVFQRSVAEVFQDIRTGLQGGRFLALCQKCENFGPYRAQMEKRVQQGLRLLPTVDG